MNGVFIIPTGIGCEIGGHAGDANPAVKLIASVCDKLIVNPNAVNASDINEMPDNCLYVEGSTIDRFLETEIGLKQVKRNKILVATNAPLTDNVVNSVNAARATIGLESEIVVLKTSLKMIAKKNEDGSAGGIVEGWEELVNQVKKHDFDALAITSQIICPKEDVIDYIEHGGVNLWGAVEAKVSRLISCALNKPVAHSPVENDWAIKENYNPPVTDARLSAEMVSVSYLHCVLKGLWKAPRLVLGISDINWIDIDFMISPYGCWGNPHKACGKNNIPIIFVRENKTIYGSNWYEKDFGSCVFVDDYLEAVGVIKAMDIGITIESIRRPLEQVKL